MKTFKYKYFLIVLMVFGFMTGCSDYLDLQPLDKPGSGSFFSNEAEVRMAVNACYNYLDPGGYSSWTGSWQFELSDLEDANGRRMGIAMADFRNGTVSPTTDIVKSYWSSYYEGIARCNLTIEGMQKAKESMESAGKTDLYNRLMSEARVIRAKAYYDLVTKFGDIPFTPVQLEMDEYKEIKRSPEDDVYSFIINEMKDAAQYLPLTYSDEAGRLTKAAAYTVLSRAALFRAFFHNGKAITPDAAYLQLVKEYTQKVIDSGSNELYYDSNNPRQSYRTLFQYKGENSKEVIMQKEFNNTYNVWHQLPMFLGTRNMGQGKAGSGPQEYLVAAYEDTLGNVVTNSPYYNPRNPYFGRDPRLYQTVMLPRVEGDKDITIVLKLSNGSSFTIKGWNTVSEGTKYTDPEGRPREFKTQLQPWTKPFGKNYDNYDWYKDQNGIDVVYGNQDGTNSYSSRVGYCWLKYIDIIDWPANELSSSLNYMLARYAEVLLMNAEARIELNDDLAKAAEYINMVRARGYGLRLQAYLSHPSHLDASMGKDKLRSYVRRERKVEFCLEGIRYDDIKRYGISQQALTSDIQGRPKFYHLEAMTNIPQVDGNGIVKLPWLDGLDPGSANYPQKWWMYSKYQAHYNLWPIPQSEFDNGVLTTEDQNPGY